MSAEQNVAALEHALAAFNLDRTPREAYFDIYAPSIRIHGYAPEPLGLDAAKGFYAVIWAAFPDARVNGHDTICEGDRVAYRFTMTGTHQGEFNGIPATGKPIALPGMTILDFENGKCVERWAIADFMALLAQIGALPG